MNKLPLDFSKITQEEIDEANRLSKKMDYTPLDFLQALVDSEQELEEKKAKKHNIFKKIFPFLHF